MSQDDSPPPLDPPISAHGQRCPRCGSTDIHGARFTLARRDAHGKIIDPAADYFSMLQVHERYCRDCKLSEQSDNDDEGFGAFEQRWTDKRRKVTWEQVQQRWDQTQRRAQEQLRERVWPREPQVHWTSEDRDAFARDIRKSYPKGYPENHELLAEVIERPDEDEPRWRYAAWMRAQPPVMLNGSGWYANSEPYPGPDPAEIADYIETHLRAAAAVRVDPKADLSSILAVLGPNRALNTRGRVNLRGGALNSDLRTDIQAMDELIDDAHFYRGFIEHVAMQAKYFLQFADELFRRAPIRHLTLTYCTDLMEELAASPHLARIRTLALPNRHDSNACNQLNALTNDHVHVLATSPHLANLAYLDLTDNGQLTPHALDHLALSPNLPALSAVRLDWNIWWDKVPPHGSYESRLQRRLVPEWAPALEARHGYLPWLHAEELYGSWEPDREIVTEHPVGLATVRPDLAARRRPPLPPALVDAIRARLDPSTRELRDRALIAPLPGGRLVATLEHAEPHPDMRDLVTLVTLTIQQAPSPAPDVFDQRTGRVVPASARTTLQLAIPTTDWPKLPPLPPAVPPVLQWGDTTGWW